MPRRAEFVILALDIGSSSTRSALFDDRGNVIAGTHARAEYRIRYTPDGGAELQPQELRRAVRRCVRQTRSALEIPLAGITGCAFWHGLLGLDRAGKPTTPILMWADGRSAPDAAQLRAEIDEREIQLRTGCMLRAPFWPAKLRWLRRTQSAVFKRTRHWVSPPQWLFDDLFGFGAVSHSMASGTGLYHLARRTWDEQLCELCAIEPQSLGPIENIKSAESVATFAAIGDGAASNLGSGADQPRVVAINIGTSAAVRAVESGAGGELPHGLFRYVVDDERYVIGGATSNGGNLRRWCMRELGFATDAAAEKALVRGAAATDSLTVLPFWTAERAPSWPESVGGTVAGITQTTTSGDLFRAITTSAYYQLADILDRLEPAIGSAEQVIVSGGVLKSPASLAILADALARDVRVNAVTESSLRGAAIYALEKLGARVPSLKAGRLIRHRRNLAKEHRDRRERQNALEQLLAR